MQFQVSKFCFLDVYEYPDVLIVSFTSSGSKINFRFIRRLIFDGGLINCVRKAFEFGMEGILIERGAARATSKKRKERKKNTSPNSSSSSFIASVSTQVDIRRTG